LKPGGQIIKLAKKNNIDMFVKTKKKLKLLKIVLFGLVTCGLLTLSSCEKEDLPLEYSIDELVFLIKNNQLDNYQIEENKLPELRNDLYSKKHELEEYLNIFLWESKQYESDLNYVRNYDIILEEKEGPFYPNNDGVQASGYTLGMGNEELIHIVVDSKHLFGNNYGNPEISGHAVAKIIFHEFGHDVLNLGHTRPDPELKEIMNVKLNYNKISLEDFINMIPSLFKIE